MEQIEEEEHSVQPLRETLQARQLPTDRENPVLQWRHCEEFVLLQISQLESGQAWQEPEARKCPV